MEYQTDRHCFSCMKTFRYPAELRRHKLRKKPCVSTPPLKTESFRCEFCDRTYKHKYNRKVHYKTCKVKNCDLTELSEVLESKNAELREQAKVIDDMRRELKEMKGGLQTGSGDNNAAITGNNNIQLNNVTINSYKTPDITNLGVKYAELMSSTLIKSVMEAIYFNPNKPENHSILSKNLQHGRIAVYDDGWKLLTSEQEIGRVIDAVKRNCLTNGGRIVNDVLPTDVTPAHTRKIESFNGHVREEADMTDCEVLGVFNKHKSMVANTKTRGE
jgi:hypothetical protein